MLIPYSIITQQTYIIYTQGNKFIKRVNSINNGSNGGK